MRHKEYDKAWTEFSQNFWSDIGDQVFTTLVASGISFTIMTSTLGIADFLGEPKKIQELNEMIFKGRLEVFIFLAEKLDFALEYLFI